MTRSNVLIGLFMILCAVPSTAAFAQAPSIAGQWKNDQTGTTFYISPERQGVFAVIRSRTDKKKSTLTAMKATWIRGMRGSQFRFKKAVGTVAYDQKSIRFAKYTWSKVADYLKPGPQAGFWSSSSGRIFLVTPAIDASFHVLNFTKIGSFVSRAAWVEGMSGVQYQYKRGELVATLSRDKQTARLLNRKTSKHFTWTRVETWPSPK